MTYSCASFGPFFCSPLWSKYSWNSRGHIGEFCSTRYGTTTWGRCSKLFQRIPRRKKKKLSSRAVDSIISSQQREKFSGRRTFLDTSREPFWSVHNWLAGRKKKGKVEIWYINDTKNENSRGSIKAHAHRMISGDMRESWKKKKMIKIEEF